jgi:hypothetical protein
MHRITGRYSDAAIANYLAASVKLITEAARQVSVALSQGPLNAYMLLIAHNISRMCKIYLGEVFFISSQNSTRLIVCPFFVTLPAESYVYIYSNVLGVG